MTKKKKTSKSKALTATERAAKDREIVGTKAIKLLKSHFEKLHKSGELNTYSAGYGSALAISQILNNLGIGQTTWAGRTVTHAYLVTTLNRACELGLVEKHTGGPVRYSCVDYKKVKAYEKAKAAAEREEAKAYADAVKTLGIKPLRYHGRGSFTEKSILKCAERYRALKTTV